MSKDPCVFDRKEIIKVGYDKCVKCSHTVYTESAIVSAVPWNKYFYRVICLNCGVKTSWESSYSEALDAWRKLSAKLKTINTWQ